jgi:glycosyltransferase involved in cell wall biosynthesis
MSDNLFPEKSNLITVIVPVYNTARYLRECVDSIINQTYKNLEIILVDDGSTDNCPQICDDYAAKDPRVKVIHKQNGGSATARNDALDIMTGDFIAFVDGDDYIALDKYETQLRALLAYDADMCSSGYLKVYKDCVMPQSPPNKPCLTEDATFIVRRFLEDNIWSALYKKELFDGLRFMKLRVGDDTLVQIQTLCKAKRYLLLTENHYYYRQRQSSIVNSKPQVDREEEIRMWQTFYTALEQSLNERFPDNALFVRSVICTNYLYNITAAQGNPGIIVTPEMSRFVKKHAFELIRSPYLTKREKQKILLYRFSKPLCNLILRKRNAAKAKSHVMFD